MSDQLQQLANDPMLFFDQLRIPSAHGDAVFGDVMADFQRERFEQLSPALLAVRAGEKPPIGRYWWTATKGVSKDSDLACCLLYLLAFTPRPLTCHVGAADRDQAAELKKAAVDILRLNSWLAELVEAKSYTLRNRLTESTCEIIAADVAGSHGARPSVLILNELSHIQKKEFAENLLDNATKVPRGLVCIATNAGFQDTWQWRWRERARLSDRWCFPSLRTAAAVVITGRYRRGEDTQLGESPGASVSRGVACRKRRRCPRLRSDGPGSAHGDVATALALALLSARSHSHIPNRISRELVCFP